MTNLQPLPGDPGTVRALADRLGGQGEQLLGLAAMLRGLAGPDVVWEGTSKAAFAERSRVAASLLVSAGRRHGVSAVALRPLAAALEQAQAAVAAATAEHVVAYPRAVALGNARVEAEQSPDPAVRATAVALQAREVAELEAVRDAERRHAQAWCDFQAADHRCAGVLQALVRDGLADSGAYDALTGVSRVAGGVDAVAGAVALFPAPPTRAIGAVASAGAAVEVLADTTLKLAWGDGDWLSIGVSAAAATTGPLSKVLRRGALATNPAAGSTATRAERRLVRYGVGERVRVGMGELRRVGGVDAHPPPRVFRPPTRVPGSPGAAAHWVAEQVKDRALHAARVRWLDDLALVTRDPARSRTMLLTGFGAEAATPGLGGAGALREHHLAHQESEAQRRRDHRFGSE